MVKKQRRRVARGKCDPGETRVVDTIARLCAEGAETLPIKDLARLADVGTSRAGNIIAKLVKAGTLERLRPRSYKVQWRWLPTGAMTKSRGASRDDLAAIRAYVRAACVEGRRTPTGVEMAAELELASAQTAFDRLRILVRDGELERRKGPDGMVWIWRATGEATALRPHGGDVRSEPARPDRPTVAEWAAGLAALKRAKRTRAGKLRPAYADENDPRACLPEPLWRPPASDRHLHGASASLACVDGW